MTPTPLILASASPRRRDLLNQIGLHFEVQPSAIHEPVYSGGPTAEYAEGLARLKAEDIATRHPKALVVGADTIVVVDNLVLGKPNDVAEANLMLSTLSNRWHEVITAYSLQMLDANIHVNTHVVTRVHFRNLTPAEIQRYIQTGAPFDKAGAYGIQDLSAIFVDEIQGCFYNVVGFPLANFYQQLSQILSEHSLELA